MDISKQVADNIKIKVVASRVLEQHRFLSHERIHFNGQLYAGHVHAQRSFLLARPH